MQPHGLRSADGLLVIPLYDMDGELWSVQLINGEGKKKFLPGGRVAGCFYPMGKSNGTTVICEGFATGASIHDPAGGLAPGEKSLAVRLTLGRDEATLTEAEIDAAVQSVITQATQRTGARLRV